MRRKTRLSVSFCQYPGGFHKRSRRIAQEDERHKSARLGARIGYASCVCITRANKAGMPGQGDVRCRGESYIAAR